MHPTRGRLISQLFVLLVFVCSSSLLAFSQGCAKAQDEQRPSSPGTPTGATAARRPVILLTGFQPFGSNRPPNPSWEGIKRLHKTRWKEYDIVCKEMEVVWGVPQKQLQTWIREYRPAAIFSFGQGGAGAYSLESIASNSRSSSRDNDGQAAPTPTIVKGGAPEYKSSSDCQQFAQLLQAKGHPSRVSTNAGRYLCEETLYSLEYLKAKDALKTTVLFCHVPPLGSSLAGERVDAKTIQAFVVDTLETWHAIHHKEPAKATKALPVSYQTPDPKKAEVEKHIRHYFSTWSKQDMKGYGECFAKGAAVQFIDSRRGVTTYALKTFLARQTESHRRSRHRMVEVPVSIEITQEALLARALVYWELTIGTEKEYGYDHFTLVKSGGGWKIVNLVFYVTKRAKR
jgi:pyroglutamyl-peptidase